MNDYVILATGKIEEIKVPLGIGVHASHCSTAMLQFDKDLASRSITSEDSKLSDYPAECLHLRVKGIGQEQRQRSEEKGNESADHCLHHKREMGPFPEARTGPEERTRLEAQLQAKLHCASAKRTTGFAEEWVADLVIGSATS